MDEPDRIVERDEDRLDSLDTLIDGLYALEASEFVAARNATAKRLRSERRRDDAATVAKLVKPTAAAAALNRIARDRPALIEALRDRGEALRSAQEDVLAGRATADVLRRAGEDRRAAVLQVVDAMRHAAPGDAGHVDEWIRTLESASVDHRVGTALQRGRVTRVVVDAIGLDGLLAPEGTVVDPGDGERETARRPVSVAVPASERAEHEPAEHEPAEHEPAEQERAEQERAEQERLADERRRAAQALRRTAAMRRMAAAQATLDTARTRREGAADALDAARLVFERATEHLAAAEAALAAAASEHAAATAELDEAGRGTDTDASGQLT